MEIKCQVDATDDFYCRAYCLLNMFRKWLLSVEFGALVFKLSVWCGAEGCLSGLRTVALKQQPATSRAPDDGHNGARNMLSKQ